MIACEKAARAARLMELDPKYADVAIQRWQDFTGKEATLEGDGRTFAAIKAERLPIDLASQDKLGKKSGRVSQYDGPPANSNLFKDLEWESWQASTK